MRFKVISGGQTGVDQAALRSAWRCLLDTGGFAPKGWETEDGPAPWLAEFGLVECERPGYPARTLANVRAAGLCLLLYAERQAGSSGTSLTRVACREHGVECFEAEFYLAGLGPTPAAGEWRANEGAAAAAADTVRRVRPATLLVAGNRERRAPGIGAAAEAWLTGVFRTLRRGEEG